MAGHTVDADARVVQGVGLGVKEWRRQRDVLQAAEHALRFRFGPVMAAATGDTDPSWARSSDVGQLVSGRVGVGQLVSGQVGVGRLFSSAQARAGDSWSAAAGGQGDEELAAARLDVGGHR